MPKPWTCPYCKRMMDEKLVPYHEPACKTAAQMTALREVIHEALKTRVELKPESEAKEHKCPQCYWMCPDIGALAIHVPLCKLVNEARLVYNGFNRVAKALEESNRMDAEAIERIEAGEDQQHHGPHGLGE